MTVHEPATLLTDYLLAALAGWLAWRLSRYRNAPGRAGAWWCGTLGLAAISAFIGGSYHGFAPNFPAALAAGWWVSTLWIISLLSAAMAMSLLHEIAPVAKLRLWGALIGIKFVCFAGFALVQPKFVLVILDYGLVMLAWAAAALLLRRAWRNWMLAAVALSVIAALVQQRAWSPSPQFNHNALFHLIQALAVYGLYRAGEKFSGPPPPTKPA